MEDFDLTPSPNLLKLLGDLRFDGWQCIAELIDNSIDAIINSKNLRDDQKEIQVIIPKPSKLRENQPLVVEDFACGMNDAELENAVRAGFSSKNTQTSLGLFGMGFNVATARLANTVEVWTSKEEMENEIGVRIDLQDMAKNQSFIRQKLTRPKRTNKKSGTQINIYDFTPVAENILKTKTIIDRLNRAYSEKIFNQHKIKIRINETEITPFRFCVWNPTRVVKIKYYDTPVHFEINHKIKDELFCENCFSWIGEPVETSLKIQCPNCHTDDRVVTKEIKITGWVGLQRFADPDHYGIDISRNGRILFKLDRSFFSWDNERAKDDPRMHPEYPRDTPMYNGRIVGQIEANYLVPKYTKDDFERDDKNWKLAVNYLRGEMPLQQDIAKSYNMPAINNSPIGILFRSWRRIHPAGVKTLIFAKVDGTPDYKRQRDWAQKFYAGDADFQDDKKWWEEVNNADMRAPRAPGFNPLDPFPIGTNGGAPGVTSPGIRYTPAPPQPEKFPGKKLLKKTLHFDLETLIGEKPYDLALIDYYPDIDLNAPLIFEPTGIGKFQVYLNNTHPMFRDFADGYEDLIYMEVASKYAALKNNEDWPITRIYYELKAKYAPETMLSIPNLVTKATNLMRDLQNKLVRGDGILLPVKANLTETDEKALTKNYLDIEGKALSNINLFTINSRFIKYLDLNYVFKFVEEFPEVIYDDKIFTLPYSELDDENKQHQLKKYSGYFSDVRWFMNDLHKMGDEAIKKRKAEIIRNRISIEILHGNFSK
jgi:hypothetical protein